jgi:hypothetical protein
MGVEANNPEVLKLFFITGTINLHSKQQKSSEKNQSLRLDYENF